MSLNHPMLNIQNRLLEYYDCLCRVFSSYLTAKADAARTAGWAPTRRAASGTAVGEGRSNYHACTYRTSNTNLFVMKSNFVNKS